MAEQQGKRGRHHPDQVQGQDGGAWRQAEVEEAMVNVPAVRGEDRLAAQEAAHDGQGDLEQRYGQREQRDGHAQQRGGLLRPDHSIAAQQEADEQRAGIAEEHRGRVEIIAEEAQQSARQGEGGVRQSDISLDERLRE